MPKKQWPDHTEWEKILNKNWTETYGDRRQEIVFIGAGMEKEELCRILDDCLVDEEDQMDIEAWSELNDPFHPWKQEGAA